MADTSQLTSTAIPERLAAALSDRYRVERLIGRGGMATVFLAHDLRHDREVALKVLEPELAAALGTDRFLSEIALTARLQHPHILPLFDSGEAAGWLYYVMPYIAGESLRARLEREQQLPVDAAVRIAAEVAEALDYAHSCGVIHRDIKPENTLLESGHAIVADFGIARALENAGGERLTATGVSIGTPAYMSPEQAAGSSRIDGRSDVYSLGCVLYELLAGEPPYTAPTVPALIAKKLSQPIPPLSVVRENVPPAVEWAVTKALARNPVDRFATGAEFAAALTGDSRPREASRLARRILPGLVLAVLCALLLLAARVLHMWPFGGPGRPGELGARTHVVLADFVPVGVPAEIAAAVTELVRSDFQQSRTLGTLSPSAVAAGLQRMRRADTLSLDARTAAELARREGLPVVISGEVRNVAGSYVLLGSVMSVPDGEVLVSRHESAPDSSRLIPAAERLSRRLRSLNGETVGDVRRSEPLERVTTASFPALLDYTRGMRAIRARDFTNAIRLLERATARDTLFAAAFVSLSGAQGNAGLAAASQRSAETAYRLRERLPHLENLWATWKYSDVTGDLPGSEAALRDILEFAPDDARALNNLSNLRLEQRRFAEAESLGMRALRLSPHNGIALSNVIEAQVAQRRFATVRSTLAHADSATREEFERYVLIATRDYRRAWAHYDSMHSDGDPVSHESLALLSLLRGRPSDAARLWGSSKEIRWLRWELRYGGNAAAISRRLDARLAQLTGDSSSLGASSPYEVIQLLAELGRVADAQVVLAKWRRLLPRDPGLREHGDLCEGVIARAAGQRERAASAFLRWYDAPKFTADYTHARGLADAAEVLDELGQSDSALVLYEKSLSMPSFGPLRAMRYEVLWYPFALRRMAQLYEARNQRDQAIEYYSRFVELWSDADPQFEPQVSAARKRLARLLRERG